MSEPKTTTLWKDCTERNDLIFMFTIIGMIIIIVSIVTILDTYGVFIRLRK